MSVQEYKIHKLSSKQFEYIREMKELAAKLESKKTVIENPEKCLRRITKIWKKITQLQDEMMLNLTAENVKDIASHIRSVFYDACKYHSEIGKNIATLFEEENPNCKSCVLEPALPTGKTFADFKLPEEENAEIFLKKLEKNEEDSPGLSKYYSKYFILFLFYVCSLRNG